MMQHLVQGKGSVELVRGAYYSGFILEGKSGDPLWRGVDLKISSSVTLKQGSRSGNRSKCVQVQFLLTIFTSWQNCGKTFGHNQALF